MRRTAPSRRALDDGLGAGWGNTLNPDLVAAAAPVRVAARLLPFAPKRAGVERVRRIQYVDGGGHQTASARRVPQRRRGTGRAGAAADPRRRLGHRQQANSRACRSCTTSPTRGWVCVAINYRLSPKATWPDHLLDCKRALAWVREHIAEYGGDPDYVVVTGGSAGGHLTALMGLTANDPQFQPGFEIGRHARARRWSRSTASTTGPNRFGQRRQARRAAASRSNGSS